jgi:hypothetical protein
MRGNEFLHTLVHVYVCYPVKIKSGAANKLTTSEVILLISVQMTGFMTKFSDVIKNTQFYTEQGLVCSLFNMEPT